MKYSQIDNTLFLKNRKNFPDKLDANLNALFNSNDIYPVSADSVLPFEQHRDIFYLSGVDQEESGDASKQSPAEHTPAVEATATSEINAT